MDVLAKLSNLVPNPSCVYDALEPILASCETPDNIAERIRLSIRLSLCEFTAAHVDFPSSCYDLSQTTLCTQMLETRATWWTTFSGNYQHIPVICQEYKPQFEANQVVDVFRNAGALFQSYACEMEKSLKTVHDAIATTTENWHFVSSNISIEIVEISEKLAGLQSAINVQQTNEYTQRVSTLLMHTAGQLSSITEVKDQLDQVSSAVHSRLTGFAETMAEIENKHLTTSDLLRTSAMQASDVLGEVNAVLHKILAAVSVFQAVCKALWVGFWPILCIVAVAFMIYMSRARHRRNLTPSMPEQAEDYTDLIFY